MSRVGKSPIAIPSKVKVDIKGSKVSIVGPKGTLEHSLPDNITVGIENNEMVIKRQTDQKNHRALHGLTRALLNNMVVGVSDGFKLVLKIIGVGYRAEIKGRTLTMLLGYSHPIVLSLPDGITVEVNPKENTVTVEGIDKALVGDVAAKIRSFRKPEPYKGKGVRYIDEVVKIKAGKAAGSA